MPQSSSARRSDACGVSASSSSVVPEISMSQCARSPTVKRYANASMSATSLASRLSARGLEDRAAVLDQTVHDVGVEEDTLR